jgi:hypothetical protein
MVLSSEITRYKQNMKFIQRVTRQQQVMHAKGYAAVCADQSSALPIYASSIAEHKQKLHLQLVS